MHRYSLKQPAFSPTDSDEGQIFSDPFAPVLKSKTTEHEKRFQNNQNTQNLLKNEENES